LHINQTINKFLGWPK